MYHYWQDARDQRESARADRLAAADPINNSVEFAEIAPAMVIDPEGCDAPSLTLTTPDGGIQNIKYFS